MDIRISATELARKLGDVISRVRYRHETFVVEKNGDPVARISPLPTAHLPTVRAVLEAWRASGERDAAFAADIERVGAADALPENPWAS